MALIQTAGPFQSSPAGAGTVTFNALANFGTGRTVILVCDDRDGIITGITVSNTAAGLDVGNGGGESWRVQSIAAGGSTAIDVAVSGPGAIAVFAFERDDITGYDQGGTAFGGPISSQTPTATAVNSGADRFVVTGIDLGIDEASITTPPGYTLAYSNLNINFTANAVAYTTVSAVETSSAAWSWATSTFASSTIATYALTVGPPPSPVPVRNDVLLGGGPLADGPIGFSLLSIPPVGIGYIKFWNGSAWVIKPIKFWNGSAWVNA